MYMIEHLSCMYIWSDDGRYDHYSLKIAIFVLNTVDYAFKYSNVHGFGKRWTLKYLILNKDEKKSFNSNLFSSWAAKIYHIKYLDVNGA